MWACVVQWGRRRYPVCGEGKTSMKKLAMLLLALVATFVPADMASARGGRGGGGGGRGSGRGSGIGKTGRNRGNNKDKKSRALMRDRALAENKDAIKRDARIDSV